MRRAFFIFCAVVTSFLAAGRTEARHASSRSPIYNEAANANQQIADAVTEAGAQNKRVLLDFGANWCSWCHKLHELFESDASVAQVLKSDYVVVMVDLNKDHNQDIEARYGHPRRFGIPVLVVLDAEGKPLTTQDSGELEQGDHHDPAKVLAFLKKWASG
ncbi:MAG: thioredoxin family protein [Verrucomicrobiota bacterium]|nr:thioredoxin family protein [Verrucomicrobiota bacterium]